MNKTTKKLIQLCNRLDREAEHFDILIDILNSDKSKEDIIKDVKKELVLGQLNRNVVVTQEIANITKEDILLDVLGSKALAYLENVLKETSQVND
jgi:ribosomal protein L18E